jgi:hypothetical protein
MNPQLPTIENLPKNVLLILHGILALWGFLDCFFGLRIFKITIRIFLGFAGAVGGAFLAARFYPNSAGLLMGACVAGLILGFVLGWFVYKIGVVVMAVLAGFVAIAPFAASLGQPLDVLVPCGVGLVAGFAAFLLLEPVVIAVTAITGAFRLVFGVLFFFGGVSITQYVSGDKNLDVLFVKGDKWVFIATLAIAAVGFCVQFAAWRRADKSADDDEE